MEEEVKKALEELREIGKEMKDGDPLTVPILIKFLRGGVVVYHDPLTGREGQASSIREVEETFRCPQCGALHGYFHYV